MSDDTPAATRRPSPRAADPVAPSPSADYPPPAPPPPPPYVPIETRKHGGLATAALVLGIIGLVLAVIPGANYVAYPLVLLAVVFGLISFKWGKGKAGFILGALGLIATILWTVAIAGAFSAANKNVKNFDQCIKKAQTSQQIDKCSDNLDDD